MFSAHTTPEEFKTLQSPVILDVCLKKTQAGKLHDYREVTVFKMFSVHTIVAFSNFSGVVWTGRKAFVVYFYTDRHTELRNFKVKYKYIF